MQGLSQLTQLTDLSFYCRMPHLRAAELATTLRPLTSLRTLIMYSLVLDNKNSVAAATGWQQVCSTHRLRTCTVHDVHACSLSCK